MIRQLTLIRQTPLVRSEPTDFPRLTPQQQERLWLSARSGQRKTGSGEGRYRALNKRTAVQRETEEPYGGLRTALYKGIRTVGYHSSI